MSGSHLNQSGLPPRQAVDMPIRWRHVRAVTQVIAATAVIFFSWLRNAPTRRWRTTPCQVAQ